MAYQNNFDWNAFNKVKADAKYTGMKLYLALNLVEDCVAGFVKFKNKEALADAEKVITLLEEMRVHLKVQQDQRRGSKNHTSSD